MNRFKGAHFTKKDNIVLERLLENLASLGGEEEMLEMVASKLYMLSALVTKGLRANFGLFAEMGATPHQGSITYCYN